HERLATHAGDPPREQAVRRLRDRVGPDRLRKPGRTPVEHLNGRLGCHVTWREPGAARRDDERRLVRELGDRIGDGVPLVWHDPTLDLVAVLGQQAGQDLAALVLAHAGGDAVRDGEHRRLHADSFVFSSSRTSPTTISLSIAFAMSYTVSAATD